MPKSRPPYLPTFQRQMVELVRTGRTPEELVSRVQTHSRGDPQLGRIRPTVTKASVVMD